MEKQVEIKVLPITPSSIFRNISINAEAIVELVVGKNIFADTSCVKTEDREWHPEDRIMPPRCPYEDIYKEEWVEGDYKMINFLRQHSTDSRITDSGGYGFMNFTKNDVLLLSITGSNDNKSGCDKIIFRSATNASQDEFRDLTVVLKELLNFEDRNRKPLASHTSTTIIVGPRKIKDFYRTLSGRLPWILETILDNSMFRRVPLNRETLRNNVHNELTLVANFPYEDVIEETFNLPPYKYKQHFRESNLTGKIISEAYASLTKNGECIVRLATINCDQYEFDAIEWSMTPPKEYNWDAVYKNIRFLFIQTDEEIFREFETLIRRNYLKEKSIEFYLEKLKVLPSMLDEISIEKSKLNAQDYIHHTVIKEIKIILQYSNEEEEEKIATHFNFSDAKSLSAYFLSKTGITPKEYRLQKI